MLDKIHSYTHWLQI